MEERHRPRPRLHGIRARPHPPQAALSGPSPGAVPARPGDRRQGNARRCLVPPRRERDGFRVMVGPPRQGRRPSALRCQLLSADPGEFLSRGDRVQASGRRRPMAGSRRHRDRTDRSPRSRLRSRSVRKPRRAGAPPARRGGGLTGNFHFRKSWGAEPVEGGWKFRIWAPARESMALQLPETGALLPMQAGGDGWLEIETDSVRPDQGYAFVLPDGTAVSDPAARAQVSGVHGASRLVDPAAFEWQTPGWRGRPLEEVILYELHTGAF